MLPRTSSLNHMNLTISGVKWSLCREPISGTISIPDLGTDQQALAALAAHQSTMGGISQVLALSVVAGTMKATLAYGASRLKLRMLIVRGKLHLHLEQELELLKRISRQAAKLVDHLAEELIHLNHKLL